MSLSETTFCRSRKGKEKRGRGWRGKKTQTKGRREQRGRERGMNRLKGGKKGKEIRSERGVETITHHDPIGDTRGGRGWWMERGWRCSLTMVCCRSCRFATCIRVHRFPLLTLFSLRLPKPDNKLSNHLSLFLSLLSSLFSLSSNTAFHAFPRFRTEEDPEEGNFRVISSPFFFFFFSTGWTRKILYRFAEWSFHGRMGARRITIRRIPRSRRTIIRRPWSRMKVADCRPTIRGNVPRSKNRRRRTSQVSGYHDWIPRGKWKRSGASSATLSLSRSSSFGITAGTTSRRKSCWPARNAPS